MSELLIPIQANLTISVMFRDPNLLREIRATLEEQFGAIEATSAEYNFSAVSPYYDAEMGGDIQKIIFSFEETIEREDLADVKIFCAEIEKKYLRNDARTVNLDPGIISLENFILATGKNYSHRIYLKNGVFAEVTLMFGKNNVIKELPWTYRDYLHEPARSFLLETREKYREKRKRLLHKNQER